MTASLPDQARAWLDDPFFATIATIEPDGRPQLSVVWVARDGDDVLVSTVKGRRKHANLVRDPHVTLLLSPPDRPYAYIEIRGTVTAMTEEPDDPDARGLIDRLAKKYRDLDVYPDDVPGAVRVKVRITPDKVVLRGV